ncbi:hypothetical protein Dimus_025001, partial [Dionaea muscipula]
MLINSRTQLKRKLKNTVNLSMLLLVFVAATARDAAAVAKCQAPLFLREMKVRGREEARREMK